MIHLLIAKVAFLSCLGYFCWRRGLRYFQALQQDAYSARRLFRWWCRAKAFDTRGTLVALGFGLLVQATGVAWIAESLAALGFYFMACRETDPRKEGKLKLKSTARLQRLLRVYRLMLIWATVLLAFFFQKSQLALGIFLWIQALPIAVGLCKVLLQNGENRRQQQYLAEAKAKWEKIQPFTIGITGSFGKTSMKHAVGNLLQSCLGPTFWPSAGTNTVMGHTREIREKMRSGTRYAVMEMGAYGKGSIRRLCDLTPPHAAIITGVGTCHLERFGSEENIYQAKSELAQALPDDGILVCNGDNLGARRMSQEFPTERTLTYGLDSDDNDCWVSDWTITKKGTAFTLHWQGESYHGETPLLGKQHLSNVLGAFTMACALGADPNYALAVIRLLQPVSNRLKLENAGDCQYLHDAYNSNPVGFEAALDVMEAIPAKRRILMTPGMVELGDQQERDNQRLAERAAGVCDIVLPVGSVNRLAILAGLRKGGLRGDQVQPCETREEAFATLDRLRKPGDLVLIENDLPDLYEQQEKY